MAPRAYCMTCGEDADLRCLRCMEETCREHLVDHGPDGCPGDEPDPDLAREED